MALSTYMIESMGLLYRPFPTRDANMGVLQTFVQQTPQPVGCSISTPSKSAQVFYAQRNQVITATIGFYQDIKAEVSDKFTTVDIDGNVLRTFMVLAYGKTHLYRRLAPYMMDVQEVH